jgi:hypothetical protein
MTCNLAISKFWKTSRYLYCILSFADVNQRFYGRKLSLRSGAR